MQQRRKTSGPAPGAGFCRGVVITMEAMRSHLIKRVLLSVSVAVGVLVLVFALIHLIPGDPVDVMLGERAQAAYRTGWKSPG